MGDRDAERAWWVKLKGYGRLIEKYIQISWPWNVKKLQEKRREEKRRSNLAAWHASLWQRQWIYLQKCIFWFSKMQRKAEEESPPTGSDRGETGGLSFFCVSLTVVLFLPFFSFFDANFAVFIYKSFLFVFPSQLFFPSFFSANTLITVSPFPKGTGRDTACITEMDV